MNAGLVADIERMILFVGQNVRPRSLLETLHRDLTYLAGQARKNPDRTPPEFNQVRWERFMAEFQQTGLLQSLKRCVADWARFEAFVSPKPKFIKFRIIGVTDASICRRWEPQEFFEACLRDYLRRHAANPRTFGRPLLIIGLKYLISEARLPYPKRDHAGIATAWRGVQPELQNLGVLNKYRCEPNLIERIRGFVRG